MMSTRAGDRRASIAAQLAKTSKLAIPWRAELSRAVSRASEILAQLELLPAREDLRDCVLDKALNVEIDLTMAMAASAMADAAELRAIAMARFGGGEN